MKNTILRKLLLVLLCLLGITFQASCMPRSNRFGVIFTNGFADIYRIPDNTQKAVEQLTFTPEIGEYPFLASQSGDKVIFEVGFTGIIEDPSRANMEERQQHVYILDTSSQQITDITNILVEYVMVPHDFSMDWSQDQKQYVVLTDGRVDEEIRFFLEFIDSDGTNKKKILIPDTGEIPSVISSIKWSPDGQKFLLGRRVIGIEQQLQFPGNAMLVYDLKSGDIVQLADHRDNCFQEEWSPTSQQIVVSCSHAPPSRNGETDYGPRTVRIFDIGNPGQAYEHNAFSSCYDPSWSADGKQIAFVCDKGTDQAGLFVINSNGNGIYEVKLDELGNPAVLMSPIWSPDGTQIVYVAGSGYEHTNIYSVHVDGSNNYSLTEQAAAYHIVSVYPLP